MQDLSILYIQWKSYYHKEIKTIFYINQTSLSKTHTEKDVNTTMVVATTAQSPNEIPVFSDHTMSLVV